MIYGVIYKISNSVNDKVYYGQTTMNPPEKRWYFHKKAGTADKCPSVIYRAMRLYGIDKFRFDVVHECETKEELDSKEIELIKTYNTLVPNGYNLEEGGAIGKPCEESKLKMRNSHLGKKATAETKEKMKNSQLGKKRLPFTEEHRKKIGDAQRGKILTEEHKRKISEATTGKKWSQESIAKRIESFKLNRIRKINDENNKCIDIPCHTELNLHTQ